MCNVGIQKPLESSSPKFFRPWEIISRNGQSCTPNFSDMLAEAAASFVPCEAPFKCVDASCTLPWGSPECRPPLKVGSNKTAAAGVSPVATGACDPVKQRFFPPGNCQPTVPNFPIPSPPMPFFPLDPPPILSPWHFWAQHPNLSFSSSLDAFEMWRHEKNRLALGPISPTFGHLMGSGEQPIHIFIFYVYLKRVNSTTHRFSACSWASSQTEEQ